jgi:Flp pilus assembly protein TadD
LPLSLPMIIPENATFLAQRNPRKPKPNARQRFSFLRRAIESNHYDPTSLVRLGVFLRKLGQNRKAIEAFRTALQIAPHDVLARVDLGRTELLDGDDNDALDEFQIVIKQKPNWPSAHEDLSAALHKAGDHVGSDLEADKALALREH